ncbi:MAG: hypothetical protein KatS3mg049_3443 [Caldilinea sp.]|nr:MAG: hypothetical protein KatS3mg049_3443 [Caldilinea sp.]
MCRQVGKYLSTGAMLFVLLIVTGCQRVAPLLEPSAARQTWGMQNPEQVYRQIFTNRSVEILHPVRLKIPVLGVDAAIEAVGRDAEGAMATPFDPNNVAWYRLGPMPGAIGNAVIAGHLDLANGKPAAFWKLGRLKAGDQVQVIMSDGSTLTFVVERLVLYPDDRAPLEEIFGFRAEPYLNLITCAGSWNKTAGAYTKRLVAYTRLIEAENAPYNRFASLGGS